MKKRNILLLLAALLAIFLFAWAVGGPDNRVDYAVDLWLTKQRHEHHWLLVLGIVLTEFGASPTTVGVAFVVGALMLWRGAQHRALVFLAVVLSGRVSIDLLKRLFDRPRPSFDVHPVAVDSASFPSGHSGNSMLCFLTLALVLAPERHRAKAVTAAVFSSILVGMSRAVLGVHWPTDVLAGWAFGAAWAICGVAILRNRYLPVATRPATGPSHDSEETGPLR